MKQTYYVVRTVRHTVQATSEREAIRIARGSMPDNEDAEAWTEDDEPRPADGTTEDGR